MITWNKIIDKNPPSETDLLILLDSDIIVHAALVWEIPSYEESCKAFQFWQAAGNNGEEIPRENVVYWAELNTPSKEELKQSSDELKCSFDN